MLASPPLAPSFEIISKSLDSIIEQAIRYGVLNDMFGYLKEHPNWIRYQRDCQDGISSSTEFGRTTEKVSLDEEIDALPVQAVEEGDIGEAVVDQQHSQVQKTTVRPILPHEILLKIANYIAAGDDFINWVKALEEEQYPSRGDLPLILQQDCGLLCVCSMHQQQERMHFCFQKCRISSHTLIFHFLFRLFILFEWLFLV